MKTIQLKVKASQRIHLGSPLIQASDVNELPLLDQGECVRVIDNRRHFLGMAYIGIQNKGLGWIYSRQEGQLLENSLWIQLLSAAVSHREMLFSSEATNAFRLFNGEGDGLGGVTIDWYDGYLVVSWYSEGIYHYRSQLLAALEVTCPNIKGIYEKIRFQTRQLPESQYVSGQEAGGPIHIKENHIQYACYLDEGLMTGIFLDQREVRNLLFKKYSAGRTILNTFSYTGAFSVAAALGQAKETTSVDVANRSLNRTREQFQVNGLNPDEHKIYVMDVFDYIKYAEKKKLKFDTIIADPPSFARTKKRTFSVAKDFEQLTIELVGITASKGCLFLSTNAANITPQQFDEMIVRGIKATGRSFRIAYQKGLPMDFPPAAHTPSSDYLKVRIIELD